ncbi:MAG: divalent-cation tolerance protein CutA [Immundisolibacter sp.]|uniref:divalent-cation tolerance protein CutA n=1 Tax=Immundisolibacter sp. TaxID=1934948 RepID=UPI003EE1C728
MAAAETLPLRLLLCACPDPGTAEDIAAALVEARLAACVTLLPGARSVYRWQGQLRRAEECVMLIKTRAADYPALEQRLLQLHPDQVPELLALPILGGNPAYLAWLGTAGD